MNRNIIYLLSIESKGIKLGLERTKSLLSACNNPQKDLPAIQITGTNGKGSTSAMIANIYKCAGLKAGLFTSPHLINLNERIRINNELISDSDINQFISKYKKDIESLDSSFFETITAMAFWYFKKHNVDVAVMETGLGGRLDSVTCCEPILSVITSISIDHAEILGDTIEKITLEKAGILKANIPCVAVHNKTDAIIEERAKFLNSTVFYINDEIKGLYKPSLKGSCQYQNAQLAELAINVINNKKISIEHIIAGIETTQWFGRNQIISTKPFVIFDVAHNEDGIMNFLYYFNSIKHTGKKILVISLQRRKNINHCIDYIQDSFDVIVSTETNNPRTMPCHVLSRLLANKCEVYKDADIAIKTIIKDIKQNDSLAIIGTHHLGQHVSNNFNISFNSV